MFMYIILIFFFFFFSSRRRHTRSYGDWSSDVCSSDLKWEGIFAREIWKAPASGTPITSDLAVKHFYPEGGYDDWVDSALTVEGKIGNFDMTYAGAYLKRTDHTYSDYSDYSLGYDTYAS